MQVDFYNDCWRYLFVKTQSIFFKLSIICALFSIVLVSFDECPVLVFGMFPHRPAYFVSALGVVLFMFSGKLMLSVQRTKILIVFVFLMITWGAIGTLIGSYAHCGDGFCSFFIKMYIVWRVIPLLYLIWFALLFSTIPYSFGRKCFSAGLLLLFFINALHMALEVISNFGVVCTKNFLVNINHYFRFEKIGHGWWPPVYFENRVRGLFAEPSHMSAALLPLFGLFLYKFKLNKMYCIPAVFFIMVLLFSKSYSGFIAMTFFSIIVFAGFLYKNFHDKTHINVLILLSSATLLATSTSYFVETKLFQHLSDQYKAAKVVAKFCESYQTDKTTTLRVPSFDDAEVKAFNRLTSFLLDVEIAKENIVGIGYVQRGFYWDCLRNVDISRFEIGLWIKAIQNDRYKGIPQLSEIGSLMAEQGFSGLCIFLILFFFIVSSGYKYANKHQDLFMFSMTTVYFALLVSLVFVPLSNFFMFYYFSGCLYGMTCSDRDQNCCPVRAT